MTSGFADDKIAWDDENRYGSRNYLHNNALLIAGSSFPSLRGAKRRGNPK
jgi:hypothetical protein